MSGLFALLYIVPAAGFAIGLWMIMLMLRQLDVSLGWRRTSFTIVATLFFAPAIIPAGTIMTAVVPHGVLVIFGTLPMLHQPRLVNFAILSFTATLVVSAIASRLIIRPTPGGNEIGSTVSQLARLLIPAGVICLLIAGLISLIPDRDIPPHIDRALVESHYGQLLDELATTLEQEDLLAARAERDRLAAVFESDELVFRVTLNDKRPDIDSFTRDVVYRERTETSSMSCSSGGDGKHIGEGLMRCTWSGRGISNIETLQYRRRFAHGDKAHVIEVHFHYPAFVKRYPAGNHSLRRCSAQSPTTSSRSPSGMAPFIKIVS